MGLSTGLSTLPPTPQAPEAPSTTGFLWPVGWPFLDFDQNGLLPRSLHPALSFSVRLSGSSYG